MAFFSLWLNLSAVVVLRWDWVLFHDITAASCRQRLDARLQNDGSYVNSLLFKPDASSFILVGNELQSRLEPPCRCEPRCLWSHSKILFFIIFKTKTCQSNHAYVVWTQQILNGPWQTSVLCSFFVDLFLQNICQNWFNFEEVCWHVCCLLR